MTAWSVIVALDHNITQMSKKIKCNCKESEEGGQVKFKYRWNEAGRGSAAPLNVYISHTQGPVSKAQQSIM